MSPIQAMNRSYSPLKHMLRDGLFAPGFRLEANRLANDLGVSMTPVRDVLHRLVGERLVDANSGDGFHVPRFTEQMLRDLYEWNAVLLTFATRTTRVVQDQGDSRPLWEIPAGAERVSSLFARLAAGAPNREIGLAIASASDRLHPFRIIEQQILAPLDGELEELVQRGTAQAQAIRRYHLRRMRAVPALLRARGEG
jgi:DNA-binding GntR family transcriptional regulator